MASPALSNLHILSSAPHPPSKNKRSSITYKLSPSRPRMLMVLAANAMGAEDSLDHLQKPSPKIRQQQQLLPRRTRVTQSAPIGLWDRFPTARTVQQMMDTMERMIEDPFAYSGASQPLAGEQSGYHRGRTPWEIREGEGEYKMRFDMPGMTKKDVKVWVEEKMLVVKAENEGKESGEKDDGWASESYGRYSMRIALPENVEVEKIKAELKDGVLYISIPKALSSSKVLDIDVQ